MRSEPMTQVQVLCPATRGDSGTRQLNVLLQQVLNPPAFSKKWLVIVSSLKHQEISWSSALQEYHGPQLRAQLTAAPNHFGSRMRRSC
jgi:ATP-dependent exoDNAse (exonuclease V) alpha subunit